MSTEVKRKFLTCTLSDRMQDADADADAILEAVANFDEETVSAAFEAISNFDGVSLSNLFVEVADLDPEMVRQCLNLNRADTYTVVEISRFWESSPDISGHIQGTPDLRASKYTSYRGSGDEFRASGSNIFYPILRRLMEQDRRVPVRIEGRLRYERKWLVPILSRIPFIDVQEEGFNVKTVREAQVQTTRSMTRGVLTRLAYVDSFSDAKKVLRPAVVTFLRRAHGHLDPTNR